MAVPSGRARRPAASRDGGRPVTACPSSRDPAPRSEFIVSHKKPPPLGTEAPFRKRCPVCGEISYSHAGIHPQCAQQRAGSLRVQRAERWEAVASTADDRPGGAQMGRWEKRCPKCNTTVHVRRGACQCGYAFAQRGT
jgi:hypothetical protein